MILESVLSNSFLLLASGSSIYVLKKHSYDQFFDLQLYFISASIGIFGFCVRSSGSLIYNLFFRTYPIDPQGIEDESAKKDAIRKGPFRNYSLFHRFFSTVGLSGLIYAVFDCNQNKTIGTVFVSSLLLFEFSCAIEAWKYKQPTGRETIIEERSFLRIFAETLDSLLDFYWILIGGYLGWVKENSFCLLAVLPHTISVLTLSSEEFDKNPSIQTSFNDYMTIAYILLMTEAIRQSPPRIIQEIV